MTLTERIERKRRELRTDRDKLEYWRGLWIVSSEKVEELHDSLHDIRQEIQRKRIVIDELDEDIRHPDWSEAERNALMEQRADELEVCLAVRDRLIIRLDDAIDLRRKRGDKKDYWDRERDEDRDRLEYLIRKRRRIREDREGRLSEHFHVAEFDCRDGTPVPVASHDALRHLCRNYLEPVHDRYGIVPINSGFRTYRYNIYIGGASMSIHVYNATWQKSPWAVAADHDPPGADPRTVQVFHDNNTHPDGMGYYSSFTHVDNRNRIGWSDSRWNGP